MIKPLAIAASGVLVGSAALAGPYVNVENNAGYNGGDYIGSATDFHVGYEASDDVYGFYVQGGPALLAPDDEDAEFELSGKIGGSVQPTEDLSVYAELSVITTNDDPSFGTKLGAKYSF